jgi:energy-coupling factor transporter ATP-binding protein EcfA2
MDINVSGYSLSHLAKLNVLLGKNGCGKSTLLKAVETSITTDGRKKYITPERGGTLNYEPNIELSLSSDLQWLGNTRRVNQLAQFRQQSVAQFRRLELNVFRASEAKREVANFQPYIDRLNVLLDNIEVRRVDPTFKIYAKPGGELLDPGSISSGEAELISLGIEALAFAEELDTSKENYLFLDEPDVHLHPDLQGRLVKFLVDLVGEYDFTMIIATHSTAILGGLADQEGATVAFMQPREKTLTFEEIGKIHRRILPVFGAHPLSNVFNEAPVLIVEGEDDERVWQQAVRSSDGVIGLYPVACEGVTSMSDYEREVSRIIGAVYENARAYSLRDRDGTEGELTDEPPIVRMKLACRATENLILSDEVLAACGITWEQAVERMDSWIANNPGHARHAAMETFRKDSYDRMAHDLKELRTLLSGVILDSTKSWEVLVGRALAAWRPPNAGEAVPQGSIVVFLGQKAAGNLLPPDVTVAV